MASFDDYLADFQRVVERIAVDHSEAPLVVGHSMGGHLALRMAARVPFAGLCLTSPMVDLHLPVARGLARAILTPLATSWAGDRRLGLDRGADRFEGNPLTSDRARFEKYRQVLRQTPILETGPPTLQWLRQALMSIDAMWKEVPTIDTPTVIFGALCDPIVPVEAMEKCAARLPNGRYVPLRGRHELLQESDDIRAALWAAMVQFWAGV
ncbi:MAG TPA: hypothetical protein DCQ06_11125 [Myxococcales bacterium]|nr:hypothetical protein [Myxococcales bacterium]